MYPIPNGGFGVIAIGGSPDEAVFPTVPEYSAGGAIVRAAWGGAVLDWNFKRNGGLTDYLVENTDLSPEVALIGIQPSGLGGDTSIDRLGLTGCYLPNPPVGEHCHAYTRYNNYYDQVTLRRILRHELGHAIGGLLDHTTDPNDCTTIMSGCWINLTQPTLSDVVSMLAVHRLAGGPSLTNLGFGYIEAKAADFSPYDTQAVAAVYKLNWFTGYYDFIHNHSGVGLGTLHYTFAENIVSESGPGCYRYQFWVSNTLPNGASGSHFTGLSNAVCF